MKERIVSGPMPEPLVQKYRQLIYVLNWLEKMGERIEVFEQSEDEMLPFRFVGKNVTIHFDPHKQRWVGMQITDGEDL